MLQVEINGELLLLAKVDDKIVAEAEMLASVVDRRSWYKYKYFKNGNRRPFS